PVVRATSLPSASVQRPPPEPVNVSEVQPGPLLPNRSPTPSLPPPPELPAALVSAAEQLTAAAVGRRQAYERLGVMVDRFGHRLSGSRSLERAIDWAIETMREDGLVQARR